MVSRIDHEMCERPKLAELRTERLEDEMRRPQSQSFGKDHKHDVKEHEQEYTESRCEVPRRKMARAEDEM